MKLRLHPDWVRFTLGETFCCALLRILPDDENLLDPPAKSSVVHRKAKSHSDFNFQLGVYRSLFEGNTLF